nr:hypothetical protein CFP56_78120 [Quercus suber]
MGAAAGQAGILPPLFLEVSYTYTYCTLNPHAPYSRPLAFSLSDQCVYLRRLIMIEFDVQCYGIVSHLIAAFDADPKSQVISRVTLMKTRVDGFIRVQLILREWLTGQLQVKIESADDYKTCSRLREYVLLTTTVQLSTRKEFAMRPRYSCIREYS